MVCRGGGRQSERAVPHRPSHTFSSCQGPACGKSPPKRPAAKGFGGSSASVTPFLFWISLIHTNLHSYR